MLHNDAKNENVSITILTLQLFVNKLPLTFITRLKLINYLECNQLMLFYIYSVVNFVPSCMNKLLMKFITIQL